MKSEEVSYGGRFSVSCFFTFLCFIFMKLYNFIPIDDSIAVSGYGWDMPNPKKPSDQPYQGVKRSSRFTEIPYRSLLPRKTENLIVVGRCISVEREVLGVFRVMGPCVAMGEAAGIAAGMTVENSCTFASVNVEALRERIKSHGGITSAEEIK